ncbi:MAG: transcriptional regulator EpsA [Thiobacillus sp.]|nr:transcriptional regulator EpsA [Thiobacillus sp.]
MKAAHQLVDAEDRYRITHILETSLAVCNAKQFFTWVQGPVFMLLPHEILLCGHAEQGHGDLKLRYFSASRYFRQEHFEIVCNPRHGLVTMAIRHWRITQRPCILPSPEGRGTCDIATVDTLSRLELRNIASHALLGPNGGVQFWFGFSRVQRLDERTAYLLEMLMPILSATYARVVASDSVGQATSSRLGNLLTAREIQVLEMVRDGMSNADVALNLSLSVMTAKNHMQNIRGKLNVRTRGQAVAEAIRLGLIRPSREEF